MSDKMSAPDREPWSSWNRGDLVIQGCEGCGAVQHPPGHLCARCHSGDMVWRPVTGAAELVSWSVVHRAPNEAFAPYVPYTVAVARLAEGALVEVWLDGVGDADVTVGDALHVEIGEVVGRRMPVARRAAM